MNYRNGFLSVIAASLLIACGGGSSSSSSSENSGKSGNVVCLDANMNTVCDVGESSEKVVSWKNYGTGVTASSVLANALDVSSPYPLAYNGTDGLVLTAPAKSTTISPFTTLVLNELETNPLYDNQSAVETELKKSFPTINSDEDFIKSLTKVLVDNKTSNQASVLGAFLTKVKKEGLEKVSTITVNSSEIKSYSEKRESALTKLEIKELFSASMQDAVDKMEKDGWVDAHDSSIKALTSNGKKVVAGSKYHNALSTIDLTSKSAKYNSFATVKGAGHGKLDATTGASENYLRDVQVTSDDYVYANIPPKKFTSTSYDKDTFGLFKAKINADGSISYKDAVRNKEKLQSFALSPSEKVIFAYNSENYLIALKNDLTTEIASLEIANILNYAVKDDNTVYALFKKEVEVEGKKTTSYYVSKITVNTASLKVAEEQIVVKNEADFMKIVNNMIVLASEHGDIETIDLTNKKVKSTKTNFNAESLDVSPNGKFLVATGDKLDIVNLNSEYREIQYSMDLKDESKAVTFISNDKIAYRKNDNEVAIVNLTDTGLVIPLVTQLENHVKSIEPNINGGAPLDIIMKDLNLTQKFNDIIFVWTTTLPTNINVTDGKVTRPPASSSNANGKLSVKASKEGVKDKSYSKDYSVMVRKIPASLPALKTLVTDAGYLDYPAVNEDGTLVLIPARYGEGDKRKYALNTYKISSDGALSNVTKNKLYGSEEQVAGVGINGSYAIFATASTKKDTYTGKIYTSKIGTDGKLADTVTKSLDITSGIPRKVEQNSDNSKVVVLIQKEDKKFISKIYNVDSSGDLSLASTIDMGDYEYETYGPAAINTDGSRIYQRDGENVHMITKEGKITSKKVENIARVWAGANRVFVTTYGGLIYSFDENLGDQKLFNTATSGRMYGGEVRNMDGKNYLFIPVQRASSTLNGIYKLEIKNDGSLEEVAFVNNVSGADRIGVSKDGKAVFFTFRNKDKKYNIAVSK